jgi:fumarylacetoacetase
MKSWIDIPPNSDFSLDNIPFGICSFPSSQSTAISTTLAPSTPRCCTAIGSYAVDLHLLAEAGLFDNLITNGSDDGEVITNFHPRIVFAQSTLNDFMSCEKYIWVAVRNRLINLFKLNNNNDDEADNRLQNNISLQKSSMHPLSSTVYHLPASIGDYTDFYSSREHATNVGIMFRGVDNALQPNWLHLPVGYHGRSSSVYPSLAHDNDDEEGDGGGGSNKKKMMSTIRRPCGQLQIDPMDPKKGSTYGPCKLMDFELEVAFFVGGPSSSPPRNSSGNSSSGSNNGSSSGDKHYSKPLTLSEAQDKIFGYVLMNDWSARDIQKWEYVPLGPFTSKNFATTISTWVVTSMALEPFRCETSAGMQDDPVPLDYLKDPKYGKERVIDLRYIMCACSLSLYPTRAH